MKKVFLVLGILALAVPAMAQNVVVNGGFEASTTALTGWTTWNGGWGGGLNAVVDVNTKAYGNQSAGLWIAPTGQPNTGQGSFGIYQTIAVTSGTQYDFSTWVKAPTAGASWAEVLLYNYKVTNTLDIDSGTASAPYLIWKRDSWGGVSGLPGGYLGTVATAGGPGNSWENVTGSISSNTGWVTIAYKWGHSGADFTGAMHIDDASLSAPVPEPSSFLALGTGLMGLAGFVVRRRK